MISYETILKIQTIFRIRNINITKQKKGHTINKKNDIIKHENKYETSLKIRNDIKRFSKQDYILIRIIFKYKIFKI